MRVWLHSGHTGCFFAKSFAVENAGNKPVLTITGFGGALVDPTLLDAFFDSLAERGLPGLAVFPDVQTVEDLVSLIVNLNESKRWACQKTMVDDFDRERDLIRLLWQTPDPQWRSEAMGLAPLITMPVTRRSPHVGIALWPGAPAAKRIYKRDEDADGVLDLLDTQHKFEKPTADSMKRKSLAATKELMKSPPDNVRYYRHVAFVLPLGSFPDS